MDSENSPNILSMGTSLLSEARGESSILVWK